MMLKDSKGNKSLTATLSIVGFIIVMLKFLLSGAQIDVAGFSYSFGTIDSLSIAAILTPILGTYAYRRHTEAVHGSTPVDETMIVGEEERNRDV